MLAKTLRQCTTSLPYRLRARCPRSPIVARHYSDEKPASSGEEQSKDTPEAPPPEPEADSPLLKAQAEAADYLGRLRYLQADFLNLQRNSAREREKTRDFAISNFAVDLLETVDVLSMALKSVPPPPPARTTPDADADADADVLPSASDDPAPEPTPDAPSPPPPTKTSDEYLRDLYTGVEITQRQLLQTLYKYHVKPFDPTGDQFDPNRHEALYQAPVPGKAPGTVIDCQKIGYTIRDRVLRAAQVGVAQETQS
ncbi:GrpE nucleotide exchange factor [Mycena alexandri]|uniref:GrpE protein homolog, mitochondrial n=1 Tax=Mycena alexandri TaxID=1745969 RepID=A0AAD6TM99_9AGAR|nr:GrpE nucleotide exchange factor [Mycena alexandri]